MKTLSVVCFLSFLLIAFPVIGQEVDVDLSKRKMEINTTETKSVDIIIKNNQEMEDRFSISVWPAIEWAGITPHLEKDKVRIDPNSSEEVKLYLTVGYDAEEATFMFSVTVKSQTNNSIMDSEKVRVEVTKKPERSAYISNVTLKKRVKPLEDLRIEVYVANPKSVESIPLSLQTNIRKGERVVKRFDDSIGKMAEKSTETIVNHYLFSKYTSPGNCSAEVILKDNLNRELHSSSVDFELIEFRNRTQEESVVYGLFSQTKTIRIKNEGNVPEENLYVTEYIPKFVENFFHPEVEPDKVEEVDSTIAYSWYIPSLPPGNEVVIKYEIDFLSIWIVGLVVIGIVFLAFRYAYAPKIVKRFRHEGPIEKGKEILISLDVKNSTLHKVKKVVVKDFVPEIAKVIKKFDTMKPKIKKTKDGTRLKWKLKSLKPMEERILTYRIKPVVKIVGTLNLPKATMKYTDKKKERKAVTSKGIVIKGK